MHCGMRFARAKQPPEASDAGIGSPPLAVDLHSLRQQPARSSLGYPIPAGNKRDWRVTKTPSRAAKTAAHFYIGVGGWTFAPWRGVSAFSGAVLQKSFCPNATKTLLILSESRFHANVK